MSDRRFDIVLFGATGFTGKLVAEYLAEHGPRDLRWCIAGRSREKLDAVRRDLAAIDPKLADMPIRIADGLDEASLEALVPEASVVCTTVGPYARYGMLLPRIAAKHGTHYCDITGEPQFIRTSIDESHDVAKRTGARIVHCCGFDSIPSDLGVHMLWDRAKRTTGRGLRWAKGFAGETRGGLSGGTIATMASIVELAGRDRSVRRLLLDPHALDPEPRPRDGDPFERDQRNVRWDADLERWTAPFLMATINARIVRRSSALVAGHYGSSFHYHEAMSLMPGAKGRVAAYAVTAALGGFAAALAFPPTRKLVTSRLKPGAGPSKEVRERGFFRFRHVAETETGEKLRGRVEGTSDPGYGETAKMLGESAIGLARGGSDLPDCAGVLTPATGLGMALVERLRRAGMTFAID